VEQWLNTSVYGLALAAVAYAAARPRLFDAEWRGRIWGAALLGLVALSAWPVVGEPGEVTAAPALHGAEAPCDEVPCYDARLAADEAGGLIALPAVPVPATLLLFAWAAVALARAGTLALAVARIRAARAASRPFPSARLERLPEWCAANGGRFALVLCERVAVPSMLGFGRPMVAVPEVWLDRLSDEALDAVLLHELAHAERRDDLLDLGQQLLVAACWFNPAGWWIASRLAFEREASCDERAARLTTTRRYARCLVTIAETMQQMGRTRRTLIASSAGPRRQLTRRVEQLLAIDVRPGLARSSYLGAPVLGALVALVVVAPALPPVFDVASSDSPGPAPRPHPVRAVESLASERPVAAAAGESAAANRAAARSARPQLRSGREDAVPPVTLASALDASTSPIAGIAPAAEPPDAPLTSRAWSAHVAPASTPAGAAASSLDVEGRTGTSAPFRTLGSAFARAGAGTGKWFSGAGASVASAFTPR
jgi:beta-lactamase regulating signal transducer with metallopeptidase domain